MNWVRLSKYSIPSRHFAWQHQTVGVYSRMSTYQHPYQQGKLGQIVEGAYADLLIIDGNPLEGVACVANTDAQKRSWKTAKCIKTRWRSMLTHWVPKTQKAGKRAFRRKRLHLINVNIATISTDYWFNDGTSLFKDEIRMKLYLLRLISTVLLLGSLLSSCAVTLETYPTKWTQLAPYRPIPAGFEQTRVRVNRRDSTNQRHPIKASWMATMASSTVTVSTCSYRITFITYLSLKIRTKT